MYDILLKNDVSFLFGCLLASIHDKKTSKKDYKSVQKKLKLMFRWKIFFRKL